MDYGDEEDPRELGLRKRNIGGGQIEEEDEIKPSETNSSGEEGHALLSKKKAKVETMPVCYSLRRCCGCLISREKRYIRLDG